MEKLRVQSSPQAVNLCGPAHLGVLEVSISNPDSVRDRISDAKRRNHRECHKSWAIHRLLALRFR